jgi:hypothetical protein
MRVQIEKDEAEALDPTRLYPLPVFMRAARLGESTLSRAVAEFGIELPTIRVGRVKFVEGAAGIDFIKQLAKAQAGATAAAV